MYPIFIYWLAKRSFYFCNNNQLTISFIIDILEYAASYKIDQNDYFWKRVYSTGLLFAGVVGLCAR